MSNTERQYPRFAADVAIRFYVDGQVVDGRTRNVSRGGLCADLGSALPTGANVEVDLTLVFDDNTVSEALRLPARVVWCTTFEGAYQIGVAFRPLEKQRADYLNLFLKYLGGEKAPRSKKATDIDRRFG